MPPGLVIFGDSRTLKELNDESVHLMVTSPPYPMIDIWDPQFRTLDKRIDELWIKMEECKDDQEKNCILQKKYMT